ncbi:proteasome assembly chaperone 1 [Homalodisca vitripennis]|uniref:proteasome assembly chaperone 1 n=1 Tax=Homalodisca vitripennis TaxID=197043 RepID=UPI001EEC713A|nr:proteasome assembly chaperone 1 [Homalodisca vitripennis]
MATYFGEIIEPNSRCFVTDGEECSIENRYSLESDIVTTDEEVQTHEYVLVACGKIMHDFVTTFLVSNHTKVVEKYSIVLKPSDSDKYTKKKMTYTLYNLTANTLLFVCEQLPHLYFANSLLVKLKPWIEKAKHTILLTTDHMSNFKPRGGLQPFMRSLRTNCCTMKVESPNLELPNTISGLPAAVMSWCQGHKKSAVVYTVYVESPHLDSIIAEPLLHLMKTPHLCHLPISQDTNKLQVIIHNAQLQNSNLYL